MNWRPLSVIGLVLLLAAAVPVAAQKKTTIKLATLAPDGSPWHRVLMDMGNEWKNGTDERVRLRIYPGGIAGELRAPEACRVLLPLYQGQGEDGYFLCRVVRPFWLRVAAVMRWLRLDAILPWLPGVRRDPDHRGSLLVNQGVARYLVVEFFHLLGFRKRRKVGSLLRFSRRRMDPTHWTRGPRRKGSFRGRPTQPVGPGVTMARGQFCPVPTRRPRSQEYP